MSSRSILILAVMFVAFAGCQRDTSFLPGEFDSVTIYSLECDFDNSSLPADAELFHGNLVLGKAEVSKEMGEKLGLTFIGRGFDVRVGVPFDRSLAEALAKVAAQCVAACPTAALAMKQQARQQP